MIKTSIEMFRGDTAVLDLAVTTNGAPTDITAWSFWLTAKVEPTDPDPGVFRVTNTDFTILSAPAGTVRCKILPAKTSGLQITSDTTYSFDIRGKESTNDVHTLANGTIKVLLGTTTSLT